MVGEVLVQPQNEKLIEFRDFKGNRKVQRIKFDDIDLLIAVPFGIPVDKGVIKTKMPGIYT